MSDHPDDIDRMRDVDALARLLNAPAFVDDDRFPGAMKAMQQDAARRDAAAILDSDDHNIHNILIRSLIRHKALLEDVRVLDDGWASAVQMIGGVEMKVTGKVNTRQRCHRTPWETIT